MSHPLPIPASRGPAAYNEPASKGPYAHNEERCGKYIKTGSAPSPLHNALLQRVAQDLITNSASAPVATLKGRVLPQASSSSVSSSRATKAYSRASSRSSSHERRASEKEYVDQMLVGDHRKFPSSCTPLAFQRMMEQRRSLPSNSLLMTRPLIGPYDDKVQQFREKAKLYISKYFKKQPSFLAEFNDLLITKEILQILLVNYPKIRKVEKKVAIIFERFRDNQSNHAELTSFINKSPKAELHTHLSGAMSPKDCMDLAIKHKLFYDPINKEFSRNFQEGFVRSQDIKGQMAEDFERAFSMKGRPADSSMQDYFFQVCRRNETVTNKLELDEMLIPNLLAAAVQNVMYTEIMVDFKPEFPMIYPEKYLHKFSKNNSVEASVNPDSPQFVGLITPATNSPANHSPLLQLNQFLPDSAQRLSEELLDSHNLQLPPSAYLTASPGTSNPSSSPRDHSPVSVTSPSPSLSTDQDEQNWSEALAILNEKPENSDEVSWISLYVNSWIAKIQKKNEEIDVVLTQAVDSKEIERKPEFNYLVEIMRDIDISKEHEFFATLACAFALINAGRGDMNKSVKIVGLNLVGPEHNITSQVNFIPQMKMLKYLKRVYNNPKVSLHAGEFGEGCSVGAFETANHLARSVDNADRIGHATALARAQYALAKIVENDIPVEVCVTSNEQTMGIQYPLKYLLDAGISAIIAADDPGILLTTLTNEFIRVVKEYKLSYVLYKNLLRNAFHYAFIEGESIFVKSKVDHRLHLRPHFWGVQNKNWRAFGPSLDIQASSKKARLQIEMEKRMVQLEKETFRKYPMLAL